MQPKWSFVFPGLLLVAVLGACIYSGSTCLPGKEEAEAALKKGDESAACHLW